MQPRHLLLIDDEDDIREVATLSLELAEGWTVMSANGGSAGAVLALSMEPDAILLDLVMPILDGHTVVRKLRQNPKTAHTPVIFVTGYQAGAIELRFSGCPVLTKPVDRDDLADALARTVAGADVMAERPQVVESSPPSHL